MPSPARWNGPVAARFANVGLSSPDKVRRLTRSSDGDDRGELMVSQDEIHFCGRNMDVPIGKPTAVSLVRERTPLPWLVALGASWLLILGTAVAKGQPLAFLAFAAAMLPTSLLLAWAARRTEWVRVDYQDEGGAEQSACFAIRGWEGRLGSTNELYRAIVDHGPGSEKPITGDEANVLGTRGRRRHRLMVAASAAWLCLVLIVTMGGVFLSSYDPLAEGSEPGYRPIDTGSLFVSRFRRSSPSVPDQYCWAPKSNFAQFVTIENTGMVPVTIYGEPPVPPYGWGDGFRQLDLAAYLDAGNKPTDPQTAPALSSKSLSSGESIELWIRYQTGDRGPTDMGYSRSLGGIGIKYSVLWVAKTAWIDVPQIEMNAACATP